MPRPFIPVPNCCLIEMVYLYGNKIIINTFHVRKPTPYTASDLQDMTQNRFDVWDSTGPNKQQFQRAGGCVLQQITGKALDTASSPVWVYTLTTARAGLMGGGNLPNNCTFAITLQSGFAGRSYRGRIYWPGLAFNHIQSGNNASEMQAVNANIMVTSVNTLIAQLAAMTTPNHLCVVSYMNSGVWRTVGVTTDITNAAYADLHLDSQRRRLLGR